MSNAEFNFDAELTRAFALAPEPADEGFAARVSGAVAQRERLRGAAGFGRVAALAVAAGAAAYGALQVVQVLAPQLWTALGPDVAMALTAQAPAIGLGAPMLFMLAAAAATAIGGAVLARENAL